MKTKKFKLALSVNQVKRIMLLIICLPCSILFVWQQIDDYHHEPAPIVINVSRFQGSIMSQNQLTGFNNMIQGNDSFTSAMKWNNAIMVYKEHPRYIPKEAGIIIYRPYDKLCGAFEYVEYHINWQGNWKTDVGIYDAKRQQIVFYPTYTTFPCVGGTTLVLITWWAVVYGLIELIAWICKKIKQGIEKRKLRKQQKVQVKKKEE